MEKHIIYSMALFSFLFLSFYFAADMVHADQSAEEIVIDRYPAEELFYVLNTKPGDSAYRSLLLQNNHNIDILYSMQLRNDGDETLFNELELLVTSSDEVIFDGKLRDFEGFIDRPLEGQSEETIDFTLKFPELLGNEFQGQTANFVLIFHAKASADNGLAKGIMNASGNNFNQGRTLPQTATNIFTYLLIGGILILSGATINYLNSKKDHIKA